MWIAIRSIFISVYTATALLSIGMAQTKLKFTALTNEHGLSDSKVTAIMQDRDGFIWIGTEEGLNRYDGYRFQVYKNDYLNKHSLSDNSINHLFSDRKNRIWISTANGLNRYDPVKDAFVRYFINDSKHGNHFDCAVEDQAGNIWVSSNNEVYTLLEGRNQFEKYFPQGREMRELYGKRVTHLFVDKHNHLWIGTQQNGLLIKYANGTLKHISDIYPLLDKARYINAINEDKQGNIWIGTNGQGLFQINHTEQSAFHYQHDPLEERSLSNNVVKCIGVDQKNQVWIGTENGGMNLYDDRKSLFHHYENDPSNPFSISQKTVSSFLEDKQGNIWIGTHRGGVNFLSPQMDKFAYYSHGVPYHNLSYKDVQTFYEDADGTIYIGTDGEGLNVWNRESDRFTYHRHDPTDPNSLGSNAVLDIIKDSKNNLWVSTWGGGLNLFDRKSGKFKRFTYQENDPQSISSDYIWKVFEDSRGNVWVATYYGGLNIMDRKNSTFKKVNLGRKDFSALIEQNFYTIEEDKYGNIWLGTDRGKALCYDPQSQEVEIYDFSAIPNYPTSNNKTCVIFRDSKNRLWFGQKGLFLFDYTNNKVVPASSEHPMKEEIIQGILEDDRNNLWISTKNGLFRYDPQTLAIKQFTTFDGLQGLEFGPNSCLKTKKGELLFGGNNGFNVLRPDNLSTNLTPPEIFLTDFQLFNKSVKPNTENSPLQQHIGLTDEIILNYDQATFSVEYTALNYIASPQNQFAYMLEGLDKDWNYVGGDRKATYNNLNPGSYIFKVKASNNDGVWNDKGKSVRITINPPFWQLWWFRTIIVLGIIGFIAFYLLMYRNLEIRKLTNKKQKEMHEVQLQFFTNISHEFRTPLTLIMGALENMKNNYQTEKNYHLVEKNAFRLSELINEVMDFRKIESGLLTFKVSPYNLRELLFHICEDFSSEAHKRNHRFIVDLPYNDDTVWCNRKVIEKIVLNLLNNAFKYTPENGTIKITLLKSLNDYQTNRDLIAEINNRLPNVHYCHILISDSGIGIAKEASDKLFERFYRISDAHMGSGIGLAFVKSLVSYHKGTIQVYSKANEGTDFIVSFPTRKADYASYEIAENSPTTQHDPVIVPTENMLNETSSPIQIKRDKKERTEQILIIDDHDEIRTFLRENLEEDYDVLDAPNGERALDILNEQIPDLIICDLMMPKMDGMQFCKKVKENPSYHHIPFIMLTAKEETATKLESMSQGADIYMTKPFSMRFIRLTITNIFKLNRNLKNRHILDFQHTAVQSVHLKRDEIFLHSLAEILENRLDNSNLKVEDLAKEMGMSQSKFYKRIKEVTGQNISEFIRSTRMKKARHILLTEDVSVTQIMYRVGISSASYFSTSFKKEFGYTPSDYLKSLEKDSAVESSKF